MRLKCVLSRDWWLTTDRVKKFSLSWPMRTATCHCSQMLLSFPIVAVMCLLLFFIQKQQEFSLFSSEVGYETGALASTVANHDVANEVGGALCNVVHGYCCPLNSVFNPILSTFSGKLHNR